MTKVFDGTNPLTDALGDEHTPYDVVITNNSTAKYVESCSRTYVAAGEEVALTVIGEFAAQQVQKNIDQHNILRGREAVSVEVDVLTMTAPVVSLVEDIDEDQTISDSENTGVFTARSTFEVGSALVGDELRIVASQNSTGYAGVDETVALDADDITAGYKDVDLGDVERSATNELTVVATLSRFGASDSLNYEFIIEEAP